MKSIKIVGFTSALAVLMVAIVALVPAPASMAVPSIAVTNVQVTPAALMPGDVGTVTVTLTNTPASMGSSTSTTQDTYNYGPGSSNGLTTPSHVAVQSTVDTSTPNGAYILKQVQLVADPPFYVTSSDFNDIGSMGAGDSATFTFNFRVDNGTPDGVYKMTLKVRTDNDGVYLNYPIKVQVESDEPQITISEFAKAYNTSDDTLSIDVFNPRDQPIQSVSIKSSGDDFVIAPQNSFVGTLAAGATYSSDFTVQSKDGKYDTLPQFVMVYRNGDNWHQTTAIVGDTQPPVVDWWSSLTDGLAENWLTFFIAGAICALIVAVFGAIVFRRQKTN